MHVKLDRKFGLHMDILDLLLEDLFEDFAVK